MPIRGGRITKGKYEITVFKKNKNGRYKKVKKFQSNKYPGDNDFPAGTKINVKYKEEKYDPSTSIKGAKYHVIVYRKGENGRRHKIKSFWDSKKPPISILGPNDSMEIHEYTPDK